MDLDRTKRRAIARRAAKALRSKRLHIIRGSWLINPITGRHCSPSNTMGNIRQWIKDEGLDNHNRECNVCLEGALMVTLAEDLTIPDDAVGHKLLRQFGSDVVSLDLKDLGVNVRGQANDIPHLNDSMLTRKPVAGRDQLAAEILERAAKS